MRVSRKMRTRPWARRNIWLFDLHELCPSISNFLRGCRLHEGIYVALTPMAEQVEGYATPLYFSEVLVTSWGVDQQRLRVYDAAEAAWYPLAGKEAARRKRAAAEAKLARLRRLLQERSEADRK